MVSASPFLRTSSSLPPLSLRKDSLLRLSSSLRAPPSHLALSRRHLSSPSPPPPFHPTLTRLDQRWRGRLPRFPVKGEEITVLREPEEFLTTLLALIKRSRKRLTISSLYIGDHEVELIDAIRSSLSTHLDLKVTFLLDKNRCTRKPWPEASTAALLYPLVRDFSPERVEVWFYKSPSFVAKLLPNRFKEGFGTWHSKIYGGDEEVIVTGANLSHDYFTTRQDRYFHFRNASSLTTYLSSLVQLYTQFSYRLLPTATTTSTPQIRSSSSSPSPSPSSASSHSSHPSSSPPSQTPYSLTWSPSSTSSPQTFQSDASKALTTFQSRWAEDTSVSSNDLDTVVWPVVQVGYLDVREEERAMSDLWEEAGELAKDGKGDRPLVDMTSGYFAFSEGYKTAVLDSKADVRIVAASPKANGFYGSKGISGLIPDGYTMLERDFERETRRRERDWKDASAASVVGERTGGVEISEWERPGWTYHAKGIWLSPSSSPTTSPILTLIGSSNLSSRSSNLDAETSFFISTSSPALQNELKQEVERLRAYSSRVGEETWKKEERRVGWRVRRIVSPLPRGLGFGKQL
ncbi:hypothetical protein BDY24DRAFT_404847 [Mrakia frigida]|uniref:CDP-diacylglycerol--glycerol-3-phosphate 3-phosphatidyltransferase n=1 Tax=Mrakia frigida TaxID=29902 RepID=UPI003FCC1025